MENVLTKEQLLEFIRKNNIQSVRYIYESLENLFIRGLLQSFLKAGIERSLGYEKYDVRKNKQTTNSWNSYSQKIVKSKFSKIQHDIPKDGKNLKPR